MFAGGTQELERTGLLLGRPAGALPALPAPERKNGRESLELKTGRSFSVDILEERARFAALSPRQKRLLYFRLIAELVVGLVLTLVMHRGFGLTLVPIAWFIEFTLLGRRAAERTQQFEGDYTALLLSLASTVRTGLDPLAALNKAYLLFSPKSVIYAELLAFKEDIERGLPEEQAIRNFAATIDYPDINLFRTALIISRKQGSALGGTLERLAKVTRQRQSFRRKVRAAVALQKISATGIGGCAVLIAFIQFTANPEAMQKALEHPLGSKLLTTGAILVIIGIVWLRRMAKSRM